MSNTMSATEVLMESIRVNAGEQPQDVRIDRQSEEMLGIFLVEEYRVDVETATNVTPGNVKPVEGDVVFNNDKAGFASATSARFQRAKADAGAIERCGNAIKGFRFAQHAPGKLAKPLVTIGQKYVLQCDCDNCKGAGRVTCGRCGGSGNLTCQRCMGTRYTTQLRQQWNGKHYTQVPTSVPCSTCLATGSVTCGGCGGSGANKCPQCEATGRLTHTNTISYWATHTSRAGLHPDAAKRQWLTTLIKDVGYERLEEHLASLTTPELRQTSTGIFRKNFVALINSTQTALSVGGKTGIQVTQMGSKYHIVDAPGLMDCVAGNKLDGLATAASQFAGTLWPDKSQPLGLLSTMAGMKICLRILALAADKTASPATISTALHGTVNPQRVEAVISAAQQSLKALSRRSVITGGMYSFAASILASLGTAHFVGLSKIYASAAGMGIGLLSAYFVIEAARHEYIKLGSESEQKDARRSDGVTKKASDLEKFMNGRKLLQRAPTLLVGACMASVGGWLSALLN